MTTIVAVAILACVAVVVLRMYRVPGNWAPAWAIVRGALQLAVLSVILAGVITSPLLVGVGIAVMFGVAVTTATMRIGAPGGRRRAVVLAAAAIAAGVAVSLTVVFASGALDFSIRYVLAMAGIVIGNTMNIVSLTGRRFAEAVNERWDEVQAWLAIGATPRQATSDMARHAVHSALVPSIDQARTTGLVTLPGAFVGAIFGGLSPLEAGRFQMLVLAALLASGAIASVTVAHVTSAVTTRPVLPDPGRSRSMRRARRSAA